MTKDSLEIEQFEVIEDPEIIIGLVGPLGVNLQNVREALKDAFAAFKYEAVNIRLTESLAEIDGLGIKLHSNPEDKRISSYMDAGTALRTKTNWGAALAIMAAGRIGEERGKRSPSKAPAKKVVYILHSLKHRDEVGALRNIYGQNFFLISVYEPVEDRIKHIALNLARTKGDGANHEKHIEKAKELVKRDAEEQGKSLGQDVQRAFPLADFFLNASHNESMKENITRFVDLLFGEPFLTPTKDETGIFFAKAASLRSADLSRQVGAAICTKRGEILTTGLNEVPKPCGGNHWSDDPSAEDNRDFREGWDSNSKKMEELFTETINIFQKIGLIPSKINDCKKKYSDKLIKSNLIKGGMESLSPADITEKILYNPGIAEVKESRISNLLEFGRVVHAEMNAITEAARLGISLKGATLYCTTFPCHMCARHIIAAGIDRVVYIEPYPKSLAYDLYNKEISVDANPLDSLKISFESFIGIAPTKYITLFNYRPRKEKNGDKKQWTRSSAKPVVKRFYPDYIEIEDTVVSKLGTKLESVGLKAKPK